MNQSDSHYNGIVIKNNMTKRYVIAHYIKLCIKNITYLLVNEYNCS